jgi:signal transduction histidine kinase
MSKIGASIMVLAFFLGFAAVPDSYAGGTAKEAEEIVKKAVEYVKANGVEKAVEAFNKKESEFIKGELYIFMFKVSDKEGARIVTLAHPINPGLVGKDLHDLKDPSGNQFMVAMAKKAMKENGGWVDYKWSHPQTKKIGEKSTYCLPTGPDTFVGCGIYK